MGAKAIQATPKKNIAEPVIYLSRALLARNDKLFTLPLLFLMMMLVLNGGVKRYKSLQHQPQPFIR